MSEDAVAVARRSLKALGPIGWGRRELADADVDALLARTAVESIPAGQVLVREGDPADRAFFVLAGRLRASVALGPGDIGDEGPDSGRTVNEIAAGELTGESALFLTGGRRTATLTATEATTVLVLNRELFVPGAPNPALVALQSRILVGLVRRIDNTGKQIVDAWRAAGGAAPPRGGLLALLGGTS
jgi:CRP-like cAMP-binding protein